MHLDLRARGYSVASCVGAPVSHFKPSVLPSKPSPVTRLLARQPRPVARQHEVKPIEISRGMVGAEEADARDGDAPIGLVQRCSLTLGLAVLALAPVRAAKTVASAKTANLANPNS